MEPGMLQIVQKQLSIENQIHFKGCKLKINERN